MLYSSQTHNIVAAFGLKKGIEMMADAGFTALDLTMFANNEYLFEPDYKETAKKIKKIADDKGVPFTQAHAPFGGGYDNYVTNLVPQLPRVFEFAGLLGIKQVVVHPLQQGRYYGREQHLFEMNMEFYEGLKHFAKDSGVKIAIENMWQRHPKNQYIVDDVCADPHELVKYYDTLNDPDVFTICLDIGHVALCCREPQDAIRIIGDKLGALHVHDVDYKSDMHTLPGMGKINYDAVCKALADIDYKGEFTLEADNFLINYDKQFKPVALKFMADCAKHYADKIEAYKAEK
jgi:sugar phosphate isomerase/epimerase